MLHPDSPFVVDKYDGSMREAAHVLGRCWSQFGAALLWGVYFVPPSHTSAVLVPSSGAKRSHLYRDEEKPGLLSFQESVKPGN